MTDVIDIDLANALYHHTRLKERVIGVDFDSQLVSALYGCVEDLARQKISTIQLATELKIRIDQLENRMKQIMSMVNAVSDKRPLLDEAITIQGQIELAVEMLEMLND